MGKTKQSSKASSSKASSSSKRVCISTSPQPSRPTRVRDPAIPSGMSHPLLQFQIQDFKEACSVLFPLPVHPTYHVMLEDLATVGLHEPAMIMIRASRFENLVNVEEPVFHELFVEFLSSFIFRGSTPVDYNRKNEVLFQLRGKKFYFSLNELAIHYGFYPELSVTAGDFDRSPHNLKNVRHHQFWREIIHAEAAQQNFDPQLCKSTNIGRPELRFLHRLITGTICGKRESTGCVSLRDLFYL